jgi:hypothetical protein
MSEIENEPEEEEPDEQEEVQEPEPEPESEPVVVRATAMPIGKGKAMKKKPGRPAKTATVQSKRAVAQDIVQEEEQDAALANAFKAVQAAMRKSSTAEEAKAKLNEALSAIGNLDDQTARHLAASEEFQQAMLKIAGAAQGKPGDPLLDEKGREIGRIPWTLDYMKEIYPEWSWIPPRTDTLSINGVDVIVYEGVQAKGPKCFFDLQMQSIESERQAARAGVAILSGSPVAYGDGFSMDVGWHKMTEEELLNQPGNREV